MFSKNIISAATWAALLAVGVGLSGCIVVPARGYGGGRGYVAEPVVPGIWVDGFWGYDGGRRTWHEGHYEHGGR